MKRALAVSVLISFVFSNLALALDFSADMVNTSKEGSFTGKIFAAKDKIRMEMAGAVTITRMDKNVAWVIMPQEKMYMEQPFDPEKIAGATEKMPGEIERTLVGHDTIDDRAADKYRIVYTSNEARATVFQWVESASGIPLKTEAMDGSWSMEYKNLVIGAQSDSLFEIPAGYAKFVMPKMADVIRAAEEAGY